MQRIALGALFSLLTGLLGAIAVFAALEGGRAWVIGATAAVLAVWMGGMARRMLRRRA